jgi:selenium metabolism protein YedF
MISERGWRSMGKIIDAMGKACPMPVMMTKKEIDNGEDSFITRVDNKVAVENLKRLASSTGFSIEVKEDDGIFAVAFSKECEECNRMLEQLEEPKKVPTSDYVVFIGKEYIGEGSEELGKNLMKMFLYTLTESEDLPNYLLFMNGGVKLPTLDLQAVDHLKVLKDKGVDILVCGACLNYYKIAEELKIGSVSNMYEIADKMKQSGKVISF